MFPFPTILCLSMDLSWYLFWHLRSHNFLMLYLFFFSFSTFLFVCYLNVLLSFSFRDCFIYLYNLKVSYICREKDIHREKGLIYWLNPHMATVASAEPSRSWEPVASSRSPCLALGWNTWAILHCFSHATSMELDEKESSQDTNCFP